MVTPLDGLPCLYCGRKFQTDDRERFHSHMRLHRKKYYGRNSLYSKWFVARKNFPTKISRSLFKDKLHRLSSKKKRFVERREVRASVDYREAVSTKSTTGRKQKKSRYPASNSKLIPFDHDDLSVHKDYIDVTFPSSLSTSEGTALRPDIESSANQEHNRPADWHHVIQWRQFWDKQLKLPVRSRQQMLNSMVVPIDATNDAEIMEIPREQDHVDLQIRPVQPRPPCPQSAFTSVAPSPKVQKTLNPVNKAFVPSIESLVNRCRYCGEVFSSEEDLIEHEGAHTGNMPYLCMICNARFALVTNFRAHEKAHFADMVMMKEGDTGQHEKEPSPPASCGESGEDKSVTPQEYNKVGRKPIYPSSGEKGFKCEYCGVVKNERRTLVEHIRVHTGERPLSCKYCNMTFAYRGSRNKHQRRHEKKAGTLDESVQCNFCDLKCSDKNLLKDHVKTKHIGDKPFKCRYCGKCFSHKCNVESHERLHTGDKPFSCPMCPATFTQLSQQVSHIRTHTGERPYKCRYCDKDFRTSSVRKNHERTHTGEKPYNCPFCSAAFARRTNLKQHLISHTDVKPKQCQYCGKGLTSNRSLKRHEESHRRKELRDLEMH